MRKIGLTLLVAGSVLASAAMATAAPPSNDPPTAARLAATWLSDQTDADGLIESQFGKLTLSAQAVVAFSAAGVGGAPADAILDELETRVEEMVVNQGSDDAGSLAYLILAAEAGGRDPRAFGTPATDLVARLIATLQGSGLFGSQFPDFDATTRQGLALLALAAVDETAPANAIDWLLDQQCPDDGNTADPELDHLWAAFRADTTQPCAVDLTAFTGPDTNSTALAILGLAAHGVVTETTSAAAALEAIRTTDGGWGFFGIAGQTTDANSTGLVLEALFALDGTPDSAGLGALLALQAGCDADPADRAGIAFQPDPDGLLVPNTLATVQAIPALAGAARPDITGIPTSAFPQICPPATTTTSTGSSTTSTTITTTTAPTSTSVLGATATTVARSRLPRTGAEVGSLAFGATALLGLGFLALGRAELRSASGPRRGRLPRS